MMKRLKIVEVGEIRSKNPKNGRIKRNINMKIMKGVEISERSGFLNISEDINEGIKSKL